MIPRPRPTPVADLPKRPGDVGCDCGKYEPNRYACLECLDRAKGWATD